MSFCKIRLSIPGKSLAITMPPEEAEVWSATLTSALLDAPQPEDEPETELKDLHNMRAKCGFCGRVWSYKTNLTDRLAETNCVACGAPITMERDKNGNYDSVGGTY